jgi:hypothetical protein
VDLNGDGYRDILSGSYAGGGAESAGTFQAFYGQADGTFGMSKPVLGTDGEPLIISGPRTNSSEAICTRPFAVDWDGDGRLDLVVGNSKGTFYWFRGEGQGNFQPQPESIKSGKKRLQLQGYHSDPFVIDWDGDGDLDLISGSHQGGAQWAENLAGKGKLPELRDFQWLIKPAHDTADDESDTDDGETGRDELVTEEAITGPAGSTRVWVADVNGDGKLDLLVGDTVSLAAPAEGLSVKTMKIKYAEWKAKLARAREIFDSPKANDRIRERALERIQELHEQFSEFVAEESTGFVWLYLQK